MLTDRQIEDTRTLQERTGFNDWNNHMTCVRVPGGVAEVAAALEDLAVSGPAELRAHEAALEVTWGSRGIIRLRSDAPATRGTITVSRPVAGASPAVSLVWLETSPSVCSSSALYDLGVELVAAVSVA